LEKSLSGVGMKNAIVVGGGQGKGAIVVDTLLENGYSVTNIGSSQHPKCNNITVDWKDIDILFVQRHCRFDHPIDFIFFSQNSSSLAEQNFSLKTDTLQTWTLIKDWTRSNWLSCQLPFLLVHTLRDSIHAETKIGWMLSSYMKHNVKDNNKHPDYSSFKYFNYLQMKCFSEQNNFKTFGIYPDFSVDKSENILYNTILQVLLDTDKHKEYFF
jgi:hypothetical protein